MKKTLKRLTCVLLTVCLTLTMLTAFAAAAEVSAAVRTTLKNAAVEAGYSRDYMGACQFVDAGNEGDAVTARLSYNVPVPGRTVAVAVVAVDRNGNALSRQQRR